MFRVKHLLLLLSLWGSLFPTLGWMRGCVVTCVRGTETRPVTVTTVTTDAACQQLCTGSPANGATPAVASACTTLGTPAFTCRGPAQFTPDGSNPTTPVCSCTCVPGAGGTGNPVTVQTTDTCPTVADASPGCAESCTRRCASPTAPVIAGMRPDPARQPACAAPISPATSPPAAETQGDTADSAGRNAVPLQLSQPIAGVSVVSDLGSYIALIYRYAIGLAGTAAVIMVVYGGFLYLLGSAADEVGKGKQIIQDALIGLLLVLGSYLILSTVNPNTLSLKLPNITPITPIELPPNTGVYGENGGQQHESVSTVSCARDLDCPRNESCMRYNYRRRDASDDGGVADSIFEFAGFHVNRTDWDIQGDHAAKLGSCSAGLEGQRCFCAGRGCQLTTTGDLGDEATQFGFGTNNRGTGMVACQAPFKCIFEQPTGGFWGWYCRDVQVRTPTPEMSRARTGISANCRSNAECNSQNKRACIAMADTALTADIRGECSNGNLGERCRCKNLGCRNNFGAQIDITCSSGLQCQLFGYGNNGALADWFCAPPGSTPASTPAPAR